MLKVGKIVVQGSPASLQANQPVRSMEVDVLCWNWEKLWSWITCFMLIDQNSRSVLSTSEKKGG